jgi:hypothetical protein
MTPRGLVILVIVAAVAVVAYATSLPGVFLYDDLPTICRNRAIRDPGNALRFFEDPDLFSGEAGNRMYRPVLLLTYLANYRAAGYQPSAWHLTNVLLHALNALLVALLATRLLPAFRRPVSGTVALLAGLSFALHPVHSEVVNYVSARSGAIATAGFLGALLLHLAWTRGRPSPLSRILLLIGSLLLFMLGLGGKEIAVAFVPTVLALELLDPEGGPPLRRLRSAVLRAAPAALVLVGYLLLREELLGTAVAGVEGRFFAVPGRADPFWGGGRTVLENLLTQSRVFWMYVWLLFFPTDLAIDRFVDVSRSVGDPRVLAALAGLLLLGLLVVWSARRRPFPAFCVLLFLFGLAPTSTLVPLNVLMNEHRLYLPGVGFALLVGAALGGLLVRWPAWGRSALGAAALCFLVLLTARNLSWQDPRAIWQENLETSPRSFRALNQLGTFEYRAAMKCGLDPSALPHLERAIAYYRDGERIYPNWIVLLQNLALSHQFRGRILGDEEDFAASARYFRACIELHPRAKGFRRDLALLLAMWGKYDEARRWYAELAAEGGLSPEAYEDDVFREVLTQLRSDGRAHLAWAGILARRGPEERERAEQAYRLAVSLGAPAVEGGFEGLLR